MTKEGLSVACSCRKAEAVRQSWEHYITSPCLGDLQGLYPIPNGPAGFGDPGTKDALSPRRLCPGIMFSPHLQLIDVKITGERHCTHLAFVRKWTKARTLPPHPGKLRHPGSSLLSCSQGSGQLLAPGPKSQHRLLEGWLNIH